MSNDATFHFAWVDPSETTFVAATHAREDEEVFGLEITQTEGEFAAASVRVVRPEDGLLNPARKQYVWLSVTKDATTTAQFFGRVVGLPKDIDDETVSLEFISQFPGWEDGRAALFETLKVSPFWDEALISANELDNPDQALEARRALYHYDRVTGEITLSDIITGSSTATVSDHFQGSTRWDVVGTPARRVKVSATAEWEQRILGETSAVNTKIKKQFPYGLVNSFSGPAMQSSWPRPGDSIGSQSGYTVIGSECSLVEDGPSNLPTESSTFRTKITQGEQAFARALFDTQVVSRDATLRRWFFRTELDIAFDYRQRRTEKITATIINDVQALAFDADGGEISIDLQCEDVVALGLLYPRYNSYFLTPRGKQSFHHLLARAQAALAASARAVEITFERPYFEALDTSCKNAITLTDPNLPGGTATGKIKSYRLGVDGETGETVAEITIAVSVGNGNTYTPSSGDPSYVEYGYVADGYQVTTGDTAASEIPSIIYTNYGSQKPPSPAIIGHLLNSDIIQDLQITNGPTSQESLLSANQYPTRENVAGIVDENPTQIALELRSLEPQDSVDHVITVEIVEPFAAPMGIDLAA